MRIDDCNLESMNYIGIMENLKEIVHTRSVGSLIQQRDKNRPGTFFWNVFNALKAIKLEGHKPGYKERIIALKKIDYPYFEKEYIDYSKSIYNLIETKSVKETRSILEFNPNYLQIIACCLIKNGDYYMFLKRNNANMPEDRLDTSVPGFVGGHIKASDGSIMSGLLRELNEEVRKIDMNNIKIKPNGFIFDQSQNVSKEHLCCLYTVEVDSRTLASTSKNETAVWYHIDDIKDMVKNQKGLDNWALIAFKHIV